MSITDTAIRTIKRVFPPDAELRARRQLFSPRTLVEACAEISRLSHLLHRERVRRLQAEGRAAQLQVRVEELERMPKSPRCLP